MEMYAEYKDITRVTGYSYPVLVRNTASASIVQAPTQNKHTLDRTRTILQGASITPQYRSIVSSSTTTSAASSTKPLPVNTYSLQT